MRLAFSALCAAFAALLVASVSTPLNGETPHDFSAATLVAPPTANWPTNGGNLYNQRYSPLTAINRTNVARLEVAWTYDTGEIGAMQTQPVVVADVLYGITPTHKAFAVNAARSSSKASSPWSC